MEDLCNIFEPFKDVTTYLSAQRYPTLPAVGPLLPEMHKKAESVMEIVQ